MRIFTRIHGSISNLKEANSEKKGTTDANAVIVGLTNHAFIIFVHQFKFITRFSGWKIFRNVFYLNNSLIFSLPCTTF